MQVLQHHDRKVVLLRHRIHEAQPSLEDLSAPGTPGLAEQLRAPLGPGWRRFGLVGPPEQVAEQVAETSVRDGSTRKLATPTDEDPPLPEGLRDQTGLADACLPRHEQDLWGAAGGVADGPVHRGKFSAPPDVVDNPTLVTHDASMTCRRAWTPTELRTLMPSVAVLAAAKASAFYTYSCWIVKAAASALLSRPVRGIYRQVHRPYAACHIPPELECSSRCNYKGASHPSDTNSSRVNWLRLWMKASDGPPPLPCGTRRLRIDCQSGLGADGALVERCRTRVEEPLDDKDVVAISVESRTDRGLSSSGQYSVGDDRSMFGFRRLASGQATYLRIVTQPVECA
jgi:hypothetical protein